MPWVPAEYKDGVGTIAVAGDANFAKMPNVFPSNQVGGRRRRHKRSGRRTSGRRSSKRTSKTRKQRGGMGFGFANPELVSKFAGSYFPITPACAGELDPSRGGNNFIGGGYKKKGGAMILGGAPLIGGGKQQGGAMILGGRRKTIRRRKSKSKKWWQVGCQKMGGMGMPGGAIPL